MRKSSPARCRRRSGRISQATPGGRSCWPGSWTSPRGPTRRWASPTRASRRIGKETALPSLELSANDFADNKEPRYFECISLYAPGHAASPEKDPRAVFRRLFGESAGGPSQSVLDAILADARSLRGRPGDDDRAKLDEYLESVRATERRIQRTEAAAKRLGPPPLPEPEGIPERRGDYLHLMADLLVHAFQCDLTRVATLVVDPERWESPRW